MKNLYIAYVDNNSYSRPDFSSFSFLSDEPITKEGADELVWERRCEEADRHEYETETCTSCEGEGSIHEVGKHSVVCEDCDGEGYHDVYEYAEHVERNSHAVVAIYDPEVHMAVPSERLEHKRYMADKKATHLSNKTHRLSDKLRELEEQVARTRADLDEAYHAAHHALEEVRELEEL